MGDDDSSDADDGLAWFKTALGAFMYDKGYRQAFALLGFPGPDAEHLMALSQLGRDDVRLCAIASCMNPTVLAPPPLWSSYQVPIVQDHDGSVVTYL